jgi:hypothetical protein
MSPNVELAKHDCAASDNEANMIEWLTAALVIITGVYAYLTWRLVKHGAFQVKRADAERAASATAYRYLIFAEILRLMTPYKRLLEGWTGEGYRSYPAGSLFPATSDALLEGLAHLHLLNAEEQRGVASFAQSLALLQRDPTIDQFEPTERIMVKRLVDEVGETLLELQKRLPHYPVSASSTVSYESISSVPSR